MPTRTWNRTPPRLRRIVLGALLVLHAFSATASGREDPLASHIPALTAGLPTPARDALAGMNTPQRKLLAARSYVKAGEQLLARWSWTSDEIVRFERSTEYRRLLAGVDAVKKQFELQNPGYSVYANMQVRTLELQLERWNSNAGVARVANELYGALEREMRTHAYPEQPDRDSVQRLKQFLLSWHPSTAAPLAAPGLSAHGQLRAIDFQITRGDEIIADASVAAVRRAWEQPGWHDRLRRAVQSVGAQFAGPLRSPNEPWHYTYVSPQQSASVP